jgi:drug/metabolite transporter (DMT)-like permease
MILSGVAALGAATCWAFGGLIAVEPTRRIGPLAFNRLRMTLVTMVLSALMLATGGWRTLLDGHAMALLLSGVVGILLGDSLLFSALARLGPRRNAVLFATNAPMTVLLAWLLLGETLGVWQVVGCLIVTFGVTLAVMFGRGRSAGVGSGTAGWDSVSGPLWIGVALALGAALCQAFGVLIAKPALVAGVDPVAASALRTGISAIGLQVACRLPFRWAAERAQANARDYMFILGSGLVGMALGMTLLLLALRDGQTGLVATLAATSPVLVLPLLRLLTKQMPPLPAWIGAGVAVMGTSLLFAV